MGKLTFGQTGLSYQCKKVSLNIDGAPKCPRCTQKVYFNEEKKAIGKSWHKRCFTCETCKKSLDSTNFNQANGEKIYCTSCYRKNCGPHVYGFVSGTRLPTRADIEEDFATVTTCQLDSQTTESYYSLPISHNKMEQSLSNDNYNNHERSSSNEKELESYIPQVKVDPAECCGRCGRQVSSSEEIQMANKKWHKNCFRCGHCGKYMEPEKCYEQDGALFCKNCYSRFFGSFVYDRSSGSMFSSTSSLSRDEDYINNKREPQMSFIESRPYSFHQ